ncbi:unnamed protein product [Candida verbasci]|uniref:Uncharacterized protein n=1 Tax=Candida verbasci TaxID=1227364 RepID=A0A9W4TVA3_9ASCO|nr:unnamed protein product [Candida verbasci]
MNKSNKIQKNTTKSSKFSKNSISSINLAEQKRKQVFRPLLDNPYSQRHWPYIANQTQNDILELLRSYIKHEEYITGFNKVVKQLEYQAQHKKFSPNSIRYVIVCKKDINNVLADIFPCLCFNAKVKLIQLPRNSAAKLGTSIIGLTKQEGVLFEILDRLDDVEIPWLSNLINNTTSYNELKILK